MKKRFLIALFFLSSAGYGLLAQTGVSASAQTQEAIALGLVNPSNDEEMLALNTRASKLCWLEDVKDGANVSNTFTLTTFDGQAVVLTPQELEHINPLLYNLPQQANTCENLIIMTTDGAYHLLVVRSEAMMQNEISRAKLKSNSKSK